MEKLITINYIIPLSSKCQTSLYTYLSISKNLKKPLHCSDIFSSKILIVLSAFGKNTDSFFRPKAIDRDSFKQNALEILLRMVLDLLLH